MSICQDYWKDTREWIRQCFDDIKQSWKKIDKRRFLYNDHILSIKFILSIREEKICWVTQTSFKEFDFEILSFFRKQIESNLGCLGGCLER